MGSMALLGRRLAPALKRLGCSTDAADPAKEPHPEAIQSGNHEPAPHTSEDTPRRSGSGVTVVPAARAARQAARTDGSTDGVASSLGRASAGNHAVSAISRRSNAPCPPPLGRAW